MSEYTPTEARLRERVKGSLGEYAHEFGIDGEAAMDAWIDQALAERDNRVRADERAKRPDREQIDRIQFEIDNVHQIHGDTCLCGFKSSRSRSRTEHLTALFAEAVLALEPEARKARRPSRVLNEYDDSTTRGLRRGEEVLRQLEHHWAADSASQAIEELLRLRRIVEAREVSHD